MGSDDGAAASRALEQIRAGLEVLAACDVEGRTSAVLGEECADILRVVGELQMQVARRLPRFDALGGPARERMPSVTAWLGHRCRLRPWEAGQLAATSRRLHLLDETVAAFEAGQIGFGDVATIAEGIDRAAGTMSEEWSPEQIAAAAQPILLEAVPQVTPGQLRKVALRVSLALDGEDAERRRRQIERQRELRSAGHPTPGGHHPELPQGGPPSVGRERVLRLLASHLPSEPSERAERAERQLVTGP